MVLAVGSHTSGQNQMAVLQATELLWRRGLEFSLLLVGDTSGSGFEFTSVLQRMQSAGRAVRAIGPLPASEGDIDGHARPLLAVGLAGYYNLLPTDIQARTADPMAPTDLDGDGRTDNVAIWQGGLELRALWRGAAVQGPAVPSPRVRSARWGRHRTGPRPAAQPARRRPR